MQKSRVMMIGLDGFELSVADRLLEEGRLPALRRLRDRSASFLLDHGSAKRSGLAWEHVASGLAPDDARRWAAVDFDPDSFGIAQAPTAMKPFPASLDCRTVVFDPPYFDLAQAPSVDGLVGWGAHDPGVVPVSRPGSLGDEIEARFGPYPATRWIYGFVWPWAERTREMAEALERAVEVRSEVAHWLFSERFPDWQLGLIVISEYHSAIEALWHGIDSTHPLHSLPSAEPARRGVENVYEAADRMVGRLMDAFPDASFAIFNLHGMGENDSDLPSMCLLPELLFRHSFGRSYLRRREWEKNEAGVPLIAGHRNWQAEIAATLPPMARAGMMARSLLRRARGRLHLGSESDRFSLGWMPAAYYRKFWPRMQAFALPSFYDGRIRINLKGREREGLVEPADYEKVCEEIERLVRDCRDPITGQPVVADVERTAGYDLSPSESDMTIVWKDAPLGFVHPFLGQIGPLPYRRTGGHTGKSGIAYFAGPGLLPGHHGTRSAFDVVPTITDLLGAAPVAGMSGRSLKQEITGDSGIAAIAC